MPRRATTLAWYRAALEDGGLNLDALAMALASLSVADVRAAFWTLEEFATEFGITRGQALGWCRRHRVRCWRLGRQSLVSKLAVLDKLTPPVVAAAVAVLNLPHHVAGA